MITSVDQLGDRHLYVEKPRRIVCLVPSITELLCDIGLEDWIIGCTKFCVHPEDLRKKKVIVGGTKKVNIQKVIELQPDIVIANKEENTKEDIEALRSLTSVWVSDVDSVDRSYDMIRSMGELFAVAKSVDDIIGSSRSTLAYVSTGVKRVAYLIWQSPYMTIGGDTYIHDMLRVSGYKNVFGESQRYPEVTIEEIKRRRPEVIFLSSEPYPFKEKHVDELKHYLTDIPIVLVDGEYFSWYGSRIIHCKDYISQLELEIKNKEQSHI